MIKSFEKNIDDLKFQNELGITETIKSNINEDFNKTDLEENRFTNDNNDLSEIKSLEELKSYIENYDKCELKNTSRSTVFSDGNSKSKIMLIGEAPGNQEDIEGKPFVGKSGKLLDKILEFINITRKNCYIINIIPWRPPGNRNPTTKEIKQCLPFVKRHIEIIKPDILVLVGSIAAKSILDKDLGITKLRGEWHSYKDKKLEIPALPIFHPAYLLRRPTNKSLVMKDILLLNRKIQYKE